MLRPRAERNGTVIHRALVASSLALSAACGNHAPGATGPDAEAQNANEAGASPPGDIVDAAEDLARDGAATVSSTEAGSDAAEDDARCYAFAPFVQPGSCPPAPPSVSSEPCDAAASETCTYDDGGVRSVFQCAGVLDVGPRWTSALYTYPTACPGVLGGGAGGDAGVTPVYPIDAAGCRSATASCDCENLSQQDHVDYELTMAILRCGLDAGTVAVRLTGGCASGLVLVDAGDAGATANCIAAQLGSQSFACAPEVQCGFAAAQ